MEFWGVEVKAGEPLKVEPGQDRILHLSQATLGEVKKDKGNESILLFVKIDGQKLVLGTLSPEKCTHISHDLVFEKGFELSHNWKNGSVYFCGYRSVIPEESDDFTDSDSGEDLPLNTMENGKPEFKGERSTASVDKANTAAKPDYSATKQKMKTVEPNKAAKSKEDDSDNDEDEEDSEEDESDDEDMLGVEDESDDEDEDDESSEEDEAPARMSDQLRKRPAESATKTPASEKKAKLVTPQKTGDHGKKGVHIATPHPSKKAGKTPANNDKAKQQTPKSTGHVSCKTCSKTFNSDNALQSHTKAKHGGGK